MRRLIPVFLAMLLLCGCVSEPVPTETQVPTTEYVPPTEPSGSYIPGSGEELVTEGALRSYAMEEPDCYAIAEMDGDILLFSGLDRTVLTRLTGDNLYPIARTELDICVYPEDPSFRITEKGITYCDMVTEELVFLDEDLQEVSRLELPEKMSGGPVLSGSRTKLYYCTADAVRVLDLETGLDRLLKEVSYPQQRLEGILLEDSVLYCGVCDDEGNEEALFLSADTGALLWQRKNDLNIASCADRYYALVPDGIMNTFLFGNHGEEAQMLIPADPWADMCYLEAADAAVTVSGAYGDLTLEYYDLGSGQRTAALNLTGVDVPCSVGAIGNPGYVYLLTGGNGDSGMIYRWDVTASPTGDDKIYTGSRYTLQNPDSQALALCADRAAELSQSYGVEILVGMDAVAVEPWDYELYPEYQVPVVEAMLDELTRILETYPKGFFAALSESAGDAPVKICLVRSLNGSPTSGSLDTANGIQFWSGSETYVALAAGEMLAQTFYHEIFHVIETCVFSRSNAYDSWNNLNPKGFDYDYDYITNLSREAEDYLRDESRSFIDTYSMSYPKEDRARIMEYAVMEGNAHYFTSETMQSKLRTLCWGIRDAFDLREYPNALLWEQYLQKPLTP